MVSFQKDGADRRWIKEDGLSLSFAVISILVKHTFVSEGKVAKTD